MSKVGSQVDNRSFNPIITNISYESLNNMRDKSINISNAFIISVPQNNSEDIVGAASIWMTDENGYLLCISKPNNM